MGSDHWVALSVCLSLCLYVTFLKPCEDLVKTVNVVNVVKDLARETIVDDPS